MSYKEFESDLIDDIIKVEGGYVNDSSDSGGETKYGITKKVAVANGYSGDMKSLSYDFAFMVYSKKYLDSLNLKSIYELAPKSAQELADTSVNMGVKRAGVFLQRSLNVLNNKEKYYDDLIVDGQIGRRSISALESFCSIRKRNADDVLCKMLNCLQGEFYISLAERREKDERFVWGWFMNRISLK